MIDLNPNHLATVERILTEHVPECEVRAFGSRATWTSKDYSDLDLAVVGKGPLDWRTLSHLRESFEDSDLPIRVDVLDWHSISERFRSVIARDYVVVQEGVAPSAMNGWREVTLGECTEFNDATYSSSEGWSFINYLDTGNITANRVAEVQHLDTSNDEIPSRARRKVKAGDIVYSTVRPNQRHHGLLKNVPENFLASTAFAVLHGREDIADTGFLYRYLAQDHIVDYLHCIAENSTSAYPSIKPSALRHLTLSLPPPLEQRAIAHVLGTLDDKIELNRRMNETLEEMARALFRDWFVDFSPVRAKMEGREPYLPHDLWSLFPGRLVESELGPIPEGWEVKRLGDVAEQRRSSVSPTDILPTTPYIALEHMPKRCIALYEWGAADGLASNKFRFERGDILFGKLRPYFHKVGVAPVSGVCSTDIVVIIPTHQDWFGFLLGHVSSPEFVEYTDATSTGTRMPRTNWSDMARYRVALPDRVVAQAFSERLHHTVERILATIHDSHALSTQRDVLLPRLVSGEVRVGAV